MQECQRIFEKIYGVEPDTTPESKRFKEREVNNEQIRRLTGARKLYQAEHIKWKGVFLSSSHVGNGQIMVSQPSLASAPPYPAHIDCIYLREGSIRCAVREQLPLANDRWTGLIRKRFPHFPLSFFSCRLSDSVHEIEVGDIQAHYARWDVSPKKLSMVLNLNKARHFTPLETRFYIDHIFYYLGLIYS